jgi:hypothetical protein
VSAVRSSGVKGRKRVKLMMWNFGRVFGDVVMMRVCEGMSESKYGRWGCYTKRIGEYIGDLMA